MTDPSIIRFLKAFKTVDDSFAAILKCNKCRKEYGVEAINPAACPEVQSELNTKKVELLKHRDRHGRQVSKLCIISFLICCCCYCAVAAAVVDVVVAVIAISAVAVVGCRCCCYGRLSGRLVAADLPGKIHRSR